MVCCLQLMEGVLGEACWFHHPLCREQGRGPRCFHVAWAGGGAVCGIGAPGRWGMGLETHFSTYSLWDFGQMHVTPISVSKISEMGPVIRVTRRHPLQAIQ